MLKFKVYQASKIERIFQENLKFQNLIFILNSYNVMMKIPLLYGKPSDKAIIKPTEQLKLEFGAPKIHYPNSCIVTFHPEIAKLIDNKYGTKLVEKIWGHYPVYEITLNKAKIGIAISMQGASGAGMFFEILIARGIKNFIFLGSAGALSKFLKVGDIVLVTKAIRDEGVSYHYEKSSKYSFPKNNLNKKLEESFRKFKINYYKGISWTCDAPFRETIRKAKKFQREGVLCSEMEAASLFSISNFRKVSTSVLVYISDVLSHFKWGYPQYKKFKKEVEENLVKVALNSLIS
jgi:uridine phosphorylase